MKKLLSMILSLAILLALAVPALAAPAEVDGADSAYVIAEDVQAWIDAHPEETASFLSDIEGYIAEEWIWYGSVAEMAEDWGESEEYIRDMLLEEWACGRMYQEEQEAWEAEWTAWKTGYEAAHPGTLAHLEANAYDYFAQEYAWYDSAEEYMANWGLTEEEFIAEMADEQLADIQAREEAQNEMNRIKESLGGVPGQLGVMLNGAYIAFPDAAPEIVDGRTMAPYRALMEALGGDADYDAATQTVSCVLENTVLTLTLGQCTLTIDENGESSTLEMDCAAYLKDDRTYVPVRFISQAFGYDVLWDQGFATAVLLDRRGAIEEIDTQFTALNRALSALTPDGSQSYQAKGNVTADLTLFDSINGDQTYRLTADASAITRGISSQGSMTMDLSALSDLIDLDALLEEEFNWYSDDEQAQLRALFNSLGDLSFEYIADAGEKALYVRSPILGILDEELAGAWLAWYGAEGAEVFGLENLTIGSLLYETALADTNTCYDPNWGYYYSAPIYTWDNLSSNTADLAAVLGDGCFTHTGQGDVLTLDAASLGLEDSDENPFSQLEFTLTVADSGAVTGSFDVRISAGSLFGLSGWPGGTICVFSGEFSFSRSGSSLTLDLHLKNTFRLELEAVSSAGVSSSDPIPAPPEGDMVIDADEVL